METLEIKYRTWYKGVPPRPIKLQIPGWGGEANQHTNGDKPQPWHCVPFVEGNTYGLELCYPFDSECRVTLEAGKPIFSGDFSKEQVDLPNLTLPPFSSFSPGHFGMTSALDIKVPEGYVLRTETHPRFYTDETGTVPCCLPGHLQTEWWPRIFFVVFKNPYPGQTIIFRKGEPYGQILIVPKKIIYDIKQMTDAEISERTSNETKIDQYAKQICKNDWHDHKCQNFDDKYKVLSRTFAKGGQIAIDKLMQSAAKKLETKLHIAKSKIKKIKNRLVMRRKDESIQDKEKKL